MDLQAAQLLDEQIQILGLPRDMERFNTYIQTMRSDVGDLDVPLVTMNPMARDEVRQQLEAWREVGAERVLEETVDAAARTLERHGLHVDGRIGLVMSDDAAGGWTDRADHDMKGRFEPGAMLRRRWLVVPLWSSEAVDLDELANRIAAHIVRVALWHRDGPPHTLQDHVELESRVAHVLGWEATPVPAAAVAAFRAHITSGAYPVIFAFMQGDEAAVRFGYDPLESGGYVGPCEARAVMDAGPMP